MSHVTGEWTSLLDSSQLRTPCDAACALARLAENPAERDRLLAHRDAGNMMSFLTRLLNSQDALGLISAAWALGVLAGGAQGRRLLLHNNDSDELVAGLGGLLCSTHADAAVYSATALGNIVMSAEWQERLVDHWALDEMLARLNAWLKHEHEAARTTAAFTIASFMRHPIEIKQSRTPTALAKLVMDLPIFPDMLSSFAILLGNGRENLKCAHAAASALSSTVYLPQGLQCVLKHRDVFKMVSCLVALLTSGHSEAEREAAAVLLELQASPEAKRIFPPTWNIKGLITRVEAGVQPGMDDSGVGPRPSRSQTSGSTRSLSNNPSSTTTPTYSHSHSRQPSPSISYQPNPPPRSQSPSLTYQQPNPHSNYHHDQYQPPQRNSTPTLQPQVPPSQGHYSHSHPHPSSAPLPSTHSRDSSVVKRGGEYNGSVDLRRESNIARAPSDNERRTYENVSRSHDGGREMIGRTHDSGSVTRSREHDQWPQDRPLDRGSPDLRPVDNRQGDGGRGEVERRHQEVVAELTAQLEKSKQSFAAFREGMHLKLQQAEEQIRNQEKSLREKSADVERLQAQASNLSNKLGQSMQTIESTSSESARHQLEISTISRERDEARRDAEGLKQQLGYAQAEVESLRGLSNDTRAARDELERRVTQLQSERASLADGAKAASELQNSVAALRDELNRQRDTHTSQLQKREVEYGQRVREAQNETMRVNDQLLAAKGESANLHRESETLRAKVREFEIATAESEKRSMSQLQAREAHVTNLQMQLNNAFAEREALCRKFESDRGEAVTTLQKQIAGYMEKESSLNKVLASKDQTILNLSTQCKTEEEQRLAAETAVSEARQTISNLQQQLGEAQHRFSESQRHIADLGHQMHNQRGEIERLSRTGEAHTSQLQRDLAAASQEIARLKQELASVHADMGRVVQEGGGLKAELTRTRDECIRVQGEMTRDREQLSVIREEWHQDRSRQLKQIEGLTIQRDALQQQIDAHLRSVLDTQVQGQQRAGALETQLHEAQRQLQDAQRQLQDTQRQAQEGQRLSTDVQRQAQSMATEIESLKSETRQLRDERESLLRQLDHERRDNNNRPKIEDVRNLERSLADVRESAAAEERRLRNLLDQAELDKQALERNLDSKQLELLRTAGEAEEFLAKSRDAASELFKLKGEREELIMQRSRDAASEMDIKGKLQAFDKLDKVNTRLRKEIEEERRARKTVEEKAQRLEMELFKNKENLANAEIAAASREIRDGVDKERENVMNLKKRLWEQELQHSASAIPISKAVLRESWSGPSSEGFNYQQQYEQLHKSSQPPRPNSTSILGASNDRGSQLNIGSSHDSSKRVTFSSDVSVHTPIIDVTLSPADPTPQRRRPEDELNDYNSQMRQYAPPHMQHEAMVNLAAQKGLAYGSQRNVLQAQQFRTGPPQPAPYQNYSSTSNIYAAPNPSYGGTPNRGHF